MLSGDVKVISIRFQTQVTWTHLGRVLVYVLNTNNNLLSAIASLNLHEQAHTSWQFQAMYSEAYSQFEVDGADTCFRFEAGTLLHPQQLDSMPRNLSNLSNATELALLRI